MRIITKRQYDAICDIVTDLQKENKKLKKSLKAKEKMLSYTNQKLSESNRKYINLCHRLAESGICYVLDFPAITKQPEDKLF